MWYSEGRQAMSVMAVSHLSLLSFTPELRASHFFLWTVRIPPKILETFNQFPKYLTFKIKYWVYMSIAIGH